MTYQEITLLVTSTAWMFSGEWTFYPHGQKKSQNVSQNNWRNVYVIIMDLYQSTILNNAYRWYFIDTSTNILTHSHIINIRHIQLIYQSRLVGKSVQSNIRTMPVYKNYHHNLKSMVINQFFCLVLYINLNFTF